MLKNLACFIQVCVCLCFLVFYVAEISTDMLEEKVSEKRDLVLNEEDYIRMEYSRDDN